MYLFNSLCINMSKNYATRFLPDCMSKVKCKKNTDGINFHRRKVLVSCA